MCWNNGCGGKSERLDEWNEHCQGSVWGSKSTETAGNDSEATGYACSGCTAAVLQWQIDGMNNKIIPRIHLSFHGLIVHIHGTHKELWKLVELSHLQKCSIVKFANLFNAFAARQILAMQIRSAQTWQDDSWCATTQQYLQLCPSMLRALWPKKQWIYRLRTSVR